jgi:hypothetical protein
MPLPLTFLITGCPSFLAIFIVDRESREVDALVKRKSQFEKEPLFSTNEESSSPL